ncbi:MAG TPA: hypothetical protein DDW27_10515 [Bacteroidales bacterium]|nr:hypothetical protein [Bacteroidales bacterium]
MNYPDYFKVLGLNTDATIADIKKAYRNKARMFHPDLNHSPEAKDKFILATEAYEFLIANFDRLNNDNAFSVALEEWKRYRQDRSRQRAQAYAQASYMQFRNSRFYKTTRMFDLTRIIFGLSLSVIIIIYTILGFITRVKYPVPEYGNPVIVFIMLLLLGTIFLVISLVYLKVYLETSRKHRKSG